tara:strand:- start:100 stop:375 length:276 start_codon:yes stop_codon:yes gene_type:complete
MFQENSTLRKKLFFRSCHRGIKEMDLILGSFAQEYLPTMTEEDLSKFQKILDIPDQELLSWCMRKVEIPHEYESDLLNQIVNYKPKKQETE